MIDWTQAEMIVQGINADRKAIVVSVDGIELKWTRGGYFIEWSRLRRPMDLVRWSHHLSTKGWFTPLRMRLLIEEVSARKGWKLHGGKRPHDRHKLTPSLRMSILTRDGFRCVLCGCGAADGARLHIDHIVPIAVGGKTERSNLQTLCADCNTGKGAT